MVEVEVCDWPSVYSGGDWTGGPAGERQRYQVAGHDEARVDHRDPEESDETSGGGDVDQTVDGGGLKELFETLHLTCLTITDNIKFI